MRFWSITNFPRISKHFMPPKHKNKISCRIQRNYSKHQTPYPQATVPLQPQYTPSIILRQFKEWRNETPAAALFSLFSAAQPRKEALENESEKKKKRREAPRKKLSPRRLREPGFGSRPARPQRVYCTDERAFREATRLILGLPACIMYTCDAGPGENQDEFLLVRLCMSAAASRRSGAGRCGTYSGDLWESGGQGTFSCTFEMENLIRWMVSSEVCWLIYNLGLRVMGFAVIRWNSVVELVSKVSGERTSWGREDKIRSKLLFLKYYHW